MHTKEEKQAGWFERNKVLGVLLAIVGVFVVLGVASQFMFEDTSKEVSTELETQLEESSPVSDELPNTPSKGKTYSASQGGYGISVEGYRFEQTGDNWGTLKEITFTITNAQGSSSLFPYVVVELKGAQMTNAESLDYLGEIIETGDSQTFTIQMNMQVGNSDEEKEFIVRIKEWDQTYVSVYFMTNLSEGFK